MKVFLIWCCLLCLGIAGNSQTLLSGVVNGYYQITSITTNSAIISSTPFFQIGDSLLIIQMQGAEINHANNFNYGKIDAYNGAGLFEFVRVCKIEGQELFFNKDFINSYDSEGSVQLISFPSVQSAIISDTVKSEPWNGSTGGVVCIHTTQNLELQSSINVSGLGLRGGQHDSSAYDCLWVDNINSFEYDLSSGYGGMKGEGISKYTANNSGKGANANGGGGGNDHNSGGGGGSNLTSGGDGGDNDDPGQWTCHGYNPGKGGRKLDEDGGDRVFMGGGGGAGHSNGPASTEGGAGGGVVILICGSITGNGQTIFANGSAGFSGQGDGAGGGGAGGTIYMDCNNVSNGLNVSITGGNGADSDGFATPRCFGPGGGGTGGALYHSGSNPPTAVTLDLGGGMNGVVANTTESCLGENQNAESGADGKTVNNVSVNWNISSVLQPFVVLGEDTAVCKSVDFKIESQTNAEKFLWNTGEVEQDLIPEQSGTYVLQGYVGGCYDVDTIEVTLFDLPLDTPETEMVLCDYAGVILSGGNEGFNHLWSNGEVTPNITVYSKGKYSLRVSSEPDCYIDFNVQVSLCHNDLDLPNTITPNGDSNNEFWIVPEIHGYPGNHLEIFTRTGILVYSTDNYSNLWNAENLPDDTYYYVLDLNNFGNKVTGFIQVIRE